MYTTFIFDLDGTLLDTKIGIINAVKITINQLNLEKLSEDILEAFIGPPMHESMEKYFHLDKKTAMEYANIFKSNYKRYSLYEAQLYDGIENLLIRLKNRNYKLAVATSKTHENARLLLQKYDILKYFDFAIGTDLECKLSKTDLVQKCIDFLQVVPKKCVLIGDSPADAKGAKNIGISFIGVTYGFGFKSEEEIKQYNPIFIANSPNEILEFIKNKANT